MNYRSPETEFNRFMELTDADEWRSIEEIVEELDAAWFWGDDLRAALPSVKARLVRQMIGQAQQGLWPLWGELVSEDEAGEPRRLWKQERRFAARDYALLVARHEALPGPLHRKRARGYRERCVRRFGRVPTLDEPAPWRAIAEEEIPY